MMKDKIQTGEEVSDVITDVTIDQITPNVIDNYIVTLFEGHHTVVLPDHVTGTFFKAWGRGKGGVFSKDVLNYSLGLPYGKYILIKSRLLNCIARIVEEEEELSFNALKLIDGHIKDKAYMILKHIEEDGKLTTSQRYINEIYGEHDVEVMVITPIKPSQDDDFEHHVGSISLFTE